MSRESQEAIRTMVATAGPQTRQRIRDLAAGAGTLATSRVDPKKYAPPYDGQPDYGCAGCDMGLPWHTSVRVKSGQGRHTVVDAHDCWGPSPLTARGKAAAAQTFERLLRR